MLGKEPALQMRKARYFAFASLYAGFTREIVVGTAIRVRGDEGFRFEASSWEPAVAISRC